jgi:hypothetical protein
MKLELWVHDKVYLYRRVVAESSCRKLVTVDVPMPGPCRYNQVVHASNPNVLSGYLETKQYHLAFRLRVEERVQRPSVPRSEASSQASCRKRFRVRSFPPCPFPGRMRVAGQRTVAFRRGVSLG